jgi:pyruvate/2-oxoglutarate dehydrogenase complex dihydrolipoamide dehydrogenase (E3) component/uncharacterized membrane protein YdjX (TVP38/TMEM64 family)
VNIRKAGLLLLIVSLVGLFFALDLDRLLTLEGFEASRAQLAAVLERSWLLVAAGYLLLYVLIAAVSIPGAAVLSLAGGALFGLFWGTVLVSFASSIGATLAFLVARYLLRDVVQRRFAMWSRVVDEGFARDGAFYLFTLRLLPLPFFLVNLAMGLTSIRALTFYWVSQVGMFGATLVYVNAGTQLARVESPGDIVSPALLASFALLGMFPLLGRRAAQMLRVRRAYARWRRPRRFERNLVVIGAGAAGLVSAYVGATVRASVTLVEAQRMGGDCLNTGCVPSKALIRGARLAHEMRHADRFGLEPVDPALEFRRLMQRVREVVRAIAPHDSVERYTALGVEVLAGHARIVDPWTVEVRRADGDRRRITTRAIVIAAGARPVVPALPGLAEVGYLTSDTLWDALADAPRAPQRLVVLGGGPIGCELAQCFQRLGSQVTQIELLERLLVREDPEVSAVVRATLAREGVEVLTQAHARRCEREGERKFIVVEHAGAERRIEFDALVCAVGRAARLEGYGLEELGIETGRTVAVNEYLETLYPNIFAAGDVAGPFQFTHAAAHQAWYAAVNALFGEVWKFRADYSVIPATTFTDPEVARVGLNEQEARERNLPYEVTRYGIDDLDRAIVDGAAEGFVKVLTVPGKDRILGATIVGAHAGELLAEFVLAMRHGLGLNKILGTIHAYPTLAEANKYAAGEWRRAHAPERLLRWVQRYHAWRRR